LIDKFKLRGKCGPLAVSKFADNRTKLASAGSRYLIDRIEGNRDLAHPLADPLGERRENVGTKIRGRNVSHVYRSQRFLNYLSLYDRQAALENRVEPPYAFAVAGKEYIVASAFDAFDQR
jgi:hypothetical protein